MTHDPSSREAAYRDLVGGLVDARVDLASQRFDAEVDAAQAAGRLDPATARVLRWWQRESVRAVTEHVRTTVPDAILSLERSALEAEESLGRADAAWRAAQSNVARSTHPTASPERPGLPVDPPVGPPVAGPPPAGAADVDRPSVPAGNDHPRPTDGAPGPAAPPSARLTAADGDHGGDGVRGADGFSAASREPAQRSTPFVAAPARDENGRNGRGARPAAPALPDHLTAAAPVQLPPPPATPPEHANDGRRRMLVAGLTVLPTDD